MEDTTTKPEGQTAPQQDHGAYEPPKLQVLGTMAELTRGATGPSDGLGAGSALG
jgi:hypothetical protein